LIKIMVAVQASYLTAEGAEERREKHEFYAKAIRATSRRGAGNAGKSNIIESYSQPIYDPCHTIFYQIFTEIYQQTNAQP
jgi:hypothetical protein